MRQQKGEKKTAKNEQVGRASGVISSKSPLHVSRATLGETPERWGGAHMGLPEHTDTIWN